ncbi:MAG: benzoyl-CoA 2,3-epoxidase subunit BoxB, partial [Planctomycetota bacterium]
GQTGVARVIRRTCEVMNETPGKDPMELGVIPLEIIQRYINFWASSSLDLFGAEVSSNSANFFGASIKGRAYEQKNYDEHTALDQVYDLDRWVDGQVVSEEVPLRNAMNEVLRDAYVKDNLKGVAYWNKECQKAGIDFEFTYPHRRFNRRVGEWSGGMFHVTTGEAMSKDAYEDGCREWLPSQEEADYVRGLMRPVTEAGKFANWIAPPLRGINGQPVEFEYVKL